MEISASAKYIRTNPRKLRLLTHNLRGMLAKKAVEKLSFNPQEGRDFLSKVIKQAIANAKNNFQLNEDKLIIDTVEVGEGPAFKRMDKSHGARFDRGLIKKRTSHIYLKLRVKEEPKTIEKKLEKKEKVIKKEVKKE